MNVGDNAENISVNEDLNTFAKKYDVLELKKMMIAIHNDIKKMKESSNQEYLNLINNNLKNEFVNSINGYMMENIDGTLNKRMVDPCDMQQQCKELFKKYLKKHTKDLNPDNISENKLIESRNEFQDLKKVKIKEKCDICFDEVSNIFESQIELIDSLKIYETNETNDEKEIATIDEKNTVKNVLEPIANEQRLKILKAISLEPQSFSVLSKLTNLRGGNLLFHLQKLQNGDLIFQKQEHGEYLLTKKGFRIINLIVNLD